MQASSFKLSSSSFAENSIIPIQHSYQDKNISPQLSWSPGPQGTKSYVIICDDPDAPRTEPWVHWIVFNIPATMQSLASGQSSKTSSVQQGINDYQEIGWGGPNPPSGTHRYVFKIYALDSMLSELMGQNPTKSELLTAMKNHKILAESKLIGKYSKQKN